MKRILKVISLLLSLNVNNYGGVKSSVHGTSVGKTVAGSGIIIITIINIAEIIKGPNRNIRKIEHIKLTTSASGISHGENPEESVSDITLTNS